MDVLLLQEDTEWRLNTMNIISRHTALSVRLFTKKEMVFNFKADTVYVIEVLQERQTFRITADTTRKNYL